MMGIRVVFPHKASLNGGPGTFQNLITNSLRNAGAIVLPCGSIGRADLVFVIGGTQKLKWLKNHKKNGAKVIHRLDGINWRHWVDKYPLKYKIISITRNKITAYIRKHFSDYIIYQSEFVENWWEKKFGHVKKSSEIIYNGTNTNIFKPANKKISDTPSLISCEGNIVIDDPLLHILQGIHKHSILPGVISRLNIIGDIDNRISKRFNSLDGINFVGPCSREMIPEKLRQGDIFLPLDVNAACPNAIIEAMASGLPVVGYDTGAMSELVNDDVGKIVNYSGNPWKLEVPDTNTLCHGIKSVVENLPKMKKAARLHAEKNHNIELVADQYLKAIGKIIKM
jgi:glycosyltransferase involved in cell wall biosynthesis